MMHTVTNADAGFPWQRAVPCVPAERCRNCALRSAMLCRAIRDDSPSRTCPSVPRRFGRGKLIVKQDESAAFLGVIRRGYARRSTMRMSGKRVLLGLAVPGDIVGGLVDQASAFEIEAATDVEICAYDSVTVKRQLLDNHRFRHLIVQEQERQHHRLLGEVWRYGTLKSRERITAFLLTAVEIMPTEPLPDGSLILNMQVERRDWADLTNTAVETISRTLRYLEEKGLVTSLTPYRLWLHDLDRLATLAGVEPPKRRMDGQDRPAAQAKDRLATPNAAARMTADMHRPPAQAVKAS